VGTRRYEEAARLNQAHLATPVQWSGEESEETFALQTNIVTTIERRAPSPRPNKLSDEIYHSHAGCSGDDDPRRLARPFTRAEPALVRRLSGGRPFSTRRPLRRRIEVLGLDHPRTLSTNAALIVDRREAGDYMRGASNRRSSPNWSAVGS